MLRSLFEDQVLSSQSSRMQEISYCVIIVKTPLLTVKFNEVIFTEPSCAVSSEMAGCHNPLTLFYR